MPPCVPCFLNILITSSTLKAFQYDDLRGSALARTDPVGIYKGISYMDFGVSNPGLANTTLAVSPESKPNRAVGFTSGASSLSVAYHGSKAKSFGLDSLFYGCETGLAQGEAETAVACNITVTGYKERSKKPVATETFEFNPSRLGILGTAPSYGIFSSLFQGLEYANVTFTPSTLVVVIVDNLIGSTVS